MDGLIAGWQVTETESKWVSKQANDQVIRWWEVDVAGRGWWEMFIFSFFIFRQSDAL